MPDVHHCASRCHVITTSAVYDYMRDAYCFSFHRRVNTTVILHIPGEIILLPSLFRFIPEPLGTTEDVTVETLAWKC